MADVIVAINKFSAAWFDVVVAAVWQSTVLACLAAIVVWLWRGLPPAGRCWVWRIVAIKMLVMVIWSANVPTPAWLAASRSPATIPASDSDANSEDSSRSAVIPESTASHASAGQAASLAASPTVSAATTVPAVSWQSWLAAIWLAMFAWQLIQLSTQRARLGQLLAASRPADDWLNRLVVLGASQLKLTRDVETRITEARISPFVCGLASPVLVLPESHVLPGEESRLRQIVLHELAHVRRGDLAWCWPTHMMRMLYWFHPIAHWVAFREALERELACDGLAIAGSGAKASDYAETLIDAASRMSRPSAFESVSTAALQRG